MSSSDPVGYSMVNESQALYGKQGQLLPPEHQQHHQQQQLTSQHSCQQCQQPMLAGEVAVICEKAGPQNVSFRCLFLKYFFSNRNNKFAKVKQKQVFVTSIYTSTPKYDREGV